MCGCGGSTQPATPPEQRAAVAEGAPMVTVTEVGPAAPGYFWTGPPSYAHQHIADEPSE